MNDDEERESDRKHEVTMMWANRALWTMDFLILSVIVNFILFSLLILKW